MIFKGGIKLKKILRIIIFITVVALTIIILVFSNVFLGNPISKFLATQSAKEYLKENYAETDYVLGEVNYNFKTGGYYARISSPSSIDSRFSVDINLLGEVQRDYYESNVVDGFNTFQRCDDGYRELVDKVLSAPDFPYISEFGYGSMLSGKEQFDDLMQYLKLDEEFDYNELGKKFGGITFYAQDNEITLEKASEILIGIKNIFDEKEVYFNEINFALEEIYVDGSPNFEGESLYIYNFLYDDIYEEGMLERVTKANEEANAF